MAGALGVELGGAATYEGVTHERPLFGTGRRPQSARPRPGIADLPRSLRVALGARAGVGCRSGVVAALMIQGCGSDVGKSLLVAGLCRLLANRGKVVRPFKPQNMSNNAAVTPDGGEIGRSTALQALACRTPPTVDMNPVLLKPQIGHGCSAHRARPAHRDAATRVPLRVIAAICCRSPSTAFAGCSAKPTSSSSKARAARRKRILRAHDIANMGFAHAADVPVVLVGDIDRGHVIASLVGAHAVLDARRSRAHPRLHRQQVSR